MKVLELLPSQIEFDQAINARASATVNQKKVDEYANNMLERHEAGLRHQINPGTVKPGSKEGKFVIITGRHRLAAIAQLNEILLKNDKKTKEEDLFKFSAIVDKDSTPENELLTSYDENEFRQDSTVFDKADVIERLLARGMTQADIAKRLHLTEGRVSQIKAAINTPKNLRKLVDEGILDEEAVIDIMNLTKDKKHLREELIEASIKFKRQEDEILQKMQAEPEEEAEEEEAEEDGKKPAAKKGTAKKKGAPAKKAAGKEHVRRAAQEKGIVEKSGQMSRKAFYAALEALTKDKDNPIPRSAKNLIGRLQEMMDGEITVTVLRNSFVKSCKTDEQLDKEKGKAAA